MPKLKNPQSKEEHNRYHQEYRDKNREKIRAYNRSYNKAWRKKYGYHNENNSQIRYPDKQKCRNITKYLIKKGVLERKPCQVCDSVLSQAHHEDYKDPYTVLWFCALHHTQHHSKKTICT